MHQFHNADRQIAFWLITLAVLIYIMVILGGVTRLTGSGLSIVEWDPIMGVIPPLNDAEWQATFEKYKAFPEYQKINRGMDLDGFKQIFIYEYAHRLLGRTIGLVFLVPFLFFYFNKRIKPGLLPRLLIMFVLGGLQGLLGWFMVKSGLVDRPNVSQYRLAAHFGTALLIYGYILWTAWGLLYPTPRNSWVPGVKRLRGQLRWLTIIVVLMVISGAFVAGTHAGAVFKTFPDMNGHFIPPGIFSMSPLYLNFFENPTTIQFTHRLIAYFIIGFVIFIWLRSRHYTLTGTTRTALNFMLLFMILQVTLGILTLLSVPSEPVRAGILVPLGAAHQGGALLLLTIVLFINHELRRGN